MCEKAARTIYAMSRWITNKQSLVCALFILKGRANGSRVTIRWCRYGIGNRNRNGLVCRCNKDRQVCLLVVFNQSIIYSVLHQQLGRRNVPTGRRRRRSYHRGIHGSHCPRSKRRRRRRKIRFNILIKIF